MLPGGVLGIALLLLKEPDSAPLTGTQCPDWADALLRAAWVSLSALASISMYVIKALSHLLDHYSHHFLLNLYF